MTGIPLGSVVGSLKYAIALHAAILGRYIALPNALGFTALTVIVWNRANCYVYIYIYHHYVTLQNKISTSLKVFLLTRISSTIFVRLTVIRLNLPHWICPQNTPSALFPTSDSRRRLPRSSPENQVTLLSRPAGRAAYQQNTSATNQQLSGSIFCGSVIYRVKDGPPAGEGGRGVGSVRQGGSRWNWDALSRGWERSFRMECSRSEVSQKSLGE